MLNTVDASDRTDLNTPGLSGREETVLYLVFMYTPCPI